MTDPTTDITTQITRCNPNAHPKVRLLGHVWFFSETWDCLVVRVLWLDRREVL